jgi:competence protein ComGC
MEWTMLRQSATGITLLLLLLLVVVVVVLLLLLLCVRLAEGAKKTKKAENALR